MTFSPSKTNLNAENKVTILCGLKPPSAPEPPGNQSRRFPPSDKPTGPPSATGARGRHPGRLREDVKRIIALIVDIKTMI